MFASPSWGRCKASVPSWHCRASLPAASSLWQSFFSLAVFLCLMGTLFVVSVCGVGLCQGRSCPAQGCGHTKDRGSIALWWCGNMLICPDSFGKDRAVHLWASSCRRCHRETVVVFCRCQRSDSDLLGVAVGVLVE